MYTFKSRLCVCVCMCACVLCVLVFMHVLMVCIYMCIYVCTLYICVCERMYILTFVGRSAMKQYLPLKPTKRGIKVWVVAESQAGYFLALQVYHAKTFSKISHTLE